MKKRIAVFVVCLVIGVACFQAGRMVEAGSAEPGSQADPLITKSYLDDRLSAAAGGYSSVQLSKGQSMQLSEGAYVVVYKGSAKITTGSMINTTEGSIFKKGNSLVMYNSFLAAGDVSLTAGSSITMYVSGSYTIT